MVSYRSVYAAALLFIKLYAKLMFKLDITRHGVMPPGPKLFVANHPSGIDPFLIHLISPQPLSVLITSNAFDAPLMGSFLRKVKQISVDPENGKPALEEARQAILAGRSVALFPEGDFSPQEGGYRQPRSGAARLALLTGVPVVPVGIYVRREWSYRIVSSISGEQTVGYWYLHGPYFVTVGEPVCFQGDVEDPSRVTEVSAGMMGHIVQLASQSEARWSSHGRAGLLTNLILRIRFPTRKRGVTIF